MEARFDAYTATTKEAGLAELVAVAGRCATPRDTWRTSHGYHGFEVRVAAVGVDGVEWAAVQAGGKRNAGVVMLEAKGERTPDVVAELRSSGLRHRCTRVDSCYDFEDEAAWERFLAQLLDVKREYRLRGERRGDWDYPEDGRTQIVGAASAAVRVTLYEKGKQSAYRHLERFGWVRLEDRVRPEEDARIAYAAASASQVWGASPWTRDLVARCLGLQVQPLPPYSARRGSSDDQALRRMVEQYGSILDRVAAASGGWPGLGQHLERVHGEHLDRRARRRRVMSETSGLDGLGVQLRAELARKHKR